MTLRQRVWGLAVVGVVALLVVAGLVAVRLAEVRSSAQEVLGVLEPASDRSAELVVAVPDMDRSALAYVLSARPEEADSYQDASRRSAQALRGLGDLLGDDPVVGPQIERVGRERQTWLEVAGRPAMAAMAAGQQAAAAATMQSEPAREAYDLLDADATVLDDTVNDLRSAQFERLEQIAVQLVWVLVGSGLALLALLVAGTVVLRRWVTHPLRALQGQMHAVMQDHELVITPSGPPELHDVGADAEAMRRKLVAEIDTAAAAEEGLSQRAPAVESIRRALEAPPEPQVPGLVIHGEVQSAEGVLAGDWWDCVALPSGETAVVVTDVAGHGPTAGVAALRLHDALTGALRRGESSETALAVSRDDVLRADAGRFATAVIVVVDPRTGALRWVNAGHHPPLVVRDDPADDGIGTLEPTGPLLVAGLDLGGFTEGRTVLEPGDVLLMFTDGLLESRGDDGAELGFDGVRRLVAEARGTAGADDPGELVARIVAAARQRAADWRRDDVTVVAVTRDLAGVAGPAVPPDAGLSAADAAKPVTAGPTAANLAP